MKRRLKLVFLTLLLVVAIATDVVKEDYADAFDKFSYVGELVTSYKKAK